jgi:hypothetical protein
MIFEESTRRDRPIVDWPLKAEPQLGSSRRISRT